MWAASCCAACACEACRTVVSGITRRSARIAYCGLFALSLIVSWILREVAAPLMEKIPCKIFFTKSLLIALVCRSLFSLLSGFAFTYVCWILVMKSLDMFLFSYISICFPFQPSEFTLKYLPLGLWFNSKSNIW